MSSTADDPTTSSRTAGAANPFDLSGRVALVTGGGRGLGRAIAEGLARAGAHVVLCGRTQATLDETAAALRAEGLAASAEAADVSREEDVVRLRDTLQGTHGKLDVLVNNAGINPIYRGIEKTTLDDWNQIVGTNLTGAFLCCKYLGALMGEGGSVINVSSIAGHRGLARAVPYCAAKGGLEIMSKALAYDWAPRGIRVNCIAPAYFETDLTTGLRGNAKLADPLVARTPMGRFGRPEEVAGAAVYLASQASSYVTGQSLLVDGGWTAA